MWNVDRIIYDSTASKVCRTKQGGRQWLDDVNENLQSLILDPWGYRGGSPTAVQA